MTKKKVTNLPQKPSLPFKGSEEIIRNLSTLPINSANREELLSQVAPEELSQPENEQQNQPAQDEKGRNESK